MKMLENERIREYIHQLIHGQKRLFIVQCNRTQACLKTPGDDKGVGDLPEAEGVGVNVLEQFLLLFLDRFFEGANRLASRNLDLKDARFLFIDNAAIEVE